MKRILIAIPIDYWPQGFWTRDAGLVVLGLRRMGYDAWVVALADRMNSSEGRPIICTTWDQISSSDWWKSQRPDAVVLCTWSAPRYDAIRQAARAAIPLVIERLDTDGIRSARLYPREFFVRECGHAREKYRRFPTWLADAYALFRTLILFLFPSLMDRRMVATMLRMQGLTAESPIARDRMQGMIEKYSNEKLQVEVVPHPVNTEILRYDGTAKENRIVTVGRWGSYQKDFPLLRKILREFLTAHPTWEATVVGGGLSDEFYSEKGTKEGWESRVTYLKSLPHEKLKTEYNRSKIYLMASRYESFCIAAAEALCCGCSVVGSSDVATSSYFAEPDSGTVATPRDLKAFLNALNAEVAAWSEQRRNPTSIASTWQEKAGSEAVGKADILMFEEIAKNLSPSEK